MELFKFKGRPLTEDESKLLLRVLLALVNNEKKEAPLQSSEALKDSFSTKIFLSRTESYDLPFAVSDAFFVMCLSTWVKTPGHIMILLRLVYQMWKETGETYFVMDDWSTRFFPMGVPTEEELEKWWISQKRDGEPLDNMVDNPTYWK